MDKRARLKIWCEMLRGFKSHPRYHIQKSGNSLMVEHLSYKQETEVRFLLTALHSGGLRMRNIRMIRLYNKIIEVLWKTNPWDFRFLLITTWEDD